MERNSVKHLNVRPYLMLSKIYDKRQLLTNGVSLVGAKNV